ncbi:MAG: septation protein IspZ [Duodenibacillus massiliensis]
MGGAADPEQAPVLAATLVAIVASVVQFGIVLARGKKPEPMFWISLVIILVFGSLTLLLHDSTFIKVKPTILYWVFAAILGFAAITGRNFLTKLLGSQIKLPKPHGKRCRLPGFFSFSHRGAQPLVAFLCETETWVNFKLLGILRSDTHFYNCPGFWITRIAAAEQNNGQAEG